MVGQLLDHLLEIAVMALRGKHSVRKAIGQAKRAWKDVYGDSL